MRPILGRKKFRTRGILEKIQEGKLQLRMVEKLQRRRFLPCQRSILEWLETEVGSGKRKKWFHVKYMKDFAWVIFGIQSRSKTGMKYSEFQRERENRKGRGEKRWEVEKVKACHSETWEVSWNDEIRWGYLRGERMRMANEINEQMVTMTRSAIKIPFQFSWFSWDFLRQLLIMLIIIIRTFHFCFFVLFLPFFLLPNPWKSKHVVLLHRWCTLHPRADGKKPTVRTYKAFPVHHSFYSFLSHPFHINPKKFSAHSLQGLSHLWRMEKDGEKRMERKIWMKKNGCKNKEEEKRMKVECGWDERRMATSCRKNWSYKFTSLRGTSYEDICEYIAITKRI